MNQESIGVNTSFPEDEPGKEESLSEEKKNEQQ